MAMRLQQSETFKVTVSFFVLSVSGKPEEFSFIAEFKRLDAEATKAFIEDKTTNDVEKLRRVLVGWTMKSFEGEEVPFTPENLDEFCKITKAPGVTVMRFIDVVGACREKP